MDGYIAEMPKLLIWSENTYNNNNNKKLKKKKKKKKKKRRGEGRSRE
jgi:hypothetical protein